jgi:hypothetical protein
MKLTLTKPAPTAKPAPIASDIRACVAAPGFTVLYTWLQSSMVVRVEDGVETDLRRCWSKADFNRLLLENGIQPLVPHKTGKQPEKLSPKEEV